jgi:hypothetical protein
MIEQSLFAVKEVPAIMGISTNNTGHKFIVREDNNSVISCVTNEYKLVTNQEVMDKALPIIERMKGTVDEVKTFSQGARTSWSFKFRKNPITIEGEKLFPQLNIKNSYDGSTQVDVLGGAFRLVCSNGLIVGRIIGHKSARHSIWNPKLQNGHIGELVEETIENIETVLNKEFPKLMSSKVKQSDIVKVIQKFPTKLIEHIVNYLTANKPKTHWDLFNAATWVLSHVSNRNHETTHRLESEMYQVIKKMAKA